MRFYVVSLAVGIHMAVLQTLTVCANEGCVRRD